MTLRDAISLSLADRNMRTLTPATVLKYLKLIASDIEHLQSRFEENGAGIAELILNPDIYRLFNTHSTDCNEQRYKERR